ncbi:MAG: hypothetical protein FWH57_00800 [Oscillospiraceae bacterium]|nr:hypothetical protein [Oscillospiraceae bacterium]
MGDTFEKRLDGATRRKSRIDKELKSRRKTRIVAVSVVLAVVVFFSAAMFINSPLIRRVLPALTIGNVDFSAAEYDYYFVYSLNQLSYYYTSMLGEEGASSYLPSNDAALSTQIQNEETGETWEDYLSAMAIENMTEIARIYDTAKAAGYEMPANIAEEIDTQISTYKEQAEMYGSAYPNLNSYLRQIFGNNINERALRRILERAMLASSYSTYISDSFTYTADQLATYYSENADNFDNFIFRTFLVAQETVEETFETDEETEAANAAALEAAREQAELIASGIESEEDFIDAAKEYDSIYYGDSDSTLMETPGSDLTYMEYDGWLKDGARVSGDVGTIDAYSGTYVIFFIRRDKNDYQTVKMRQILLLMDTVDSSIYEEGLEDPEYLEALRQAEIAVKGRADEVQSLFNAGGATEEMLLELMSDYSDDSTEGGLYEDIQKGTLVTEIEDWLFDPVRKYGDNSLIKSAAYGYHLVFFMGYGDKSCDVTAKNDLRESDYQTWTEGLAEVETTTRWAFSLREKR